MEEVLKDGSVTPFSLPYLILFHLERPFPLAWVGGKGEAQALGSGLVGCAFYYQGHILGSAASDTRLPGGLLVYQVEEPD